MSRPGLHSIALLVVAVAVMAGCSGVRLGAFSGDLWPSYEHPRNTFERQTWHIYSGIVERCDAAGIGRPDAPTVIMTNVVVSTNIYGTNTVVSTNVAGLRECLLRYKEKTTALIPYFLNMSGADTNGVLATNTAFVNWTTNEFHAACFLPSNFFAYTEHRMLGGLGVLTNDAEAVGRAHGYTNESTAAAGTNYLPAGRSTWYTTDYGIDGLRVALKNLRYRTATTIRRKPTSSVSVYEYGYDSAYWGDSWETVADRAEAGPYATNSFSTWVNGDIDVTYWAFVEHKNREWWYWTPSPGEYRTTNYWAISMLWETSAVVVVTNMATNFPADIDVYVWASAHSTNFDYENGEDYRWTTGPSTFDDMDIGLGDNEWRKLGETIPWDGAGKAVTAVVHRGFARHPARPQEPLPTLRAFTNDYPDWMVGFSIAGFRLTNSAAVLNYRFEFK